jgi:hypothetical protein
LAAKADAQFAAIQGEIQDDNNAQAMSLFNSKLINQSLLTYFFSSKIKIKNSIKVNKLFYQAV